MLFRSGCAGRPDASQHHIFAPSFNSALGATWGPPPPGEAFDDAVSRIGLSPAVPQRAAAMFILYHSSRAALGRLTRPRLLELARAAVREAKLGMSAALVVCFTTASLILGGTTCSMLPVQWRRPCFLRVSSCRRSSFKTVMPTIAQVVPPECKIGRAHV